MGRLVPGIDAHHQYRAGSHHCKATEIKEDYIRRACKMCPDCAVVDLDREVSVRPYGV